MDNACDSWEAVTSSKIPNSRTIFKLRFSGPSAAKVRDEHLALTAGNDLRHFGLPHGGVPFVKCDLI
jgi:hypothetical protein